MGGKFARCWKQFLFYAQRSVNLILLPFLIRETSMKKFCSECGHPLEISKKFCSDCGNSNPFFSISHEIPSARSSAIDTLRARKESIEKELAEIEQEQKEVQRKEKLRLEMEELERQRMVRFEKEKEIKERFEREGLEAVIKKELEQVKAETEQYKQQTNELLKELKGVVLQIDEENRKLKEEVQQIAKTQVVVAPEVQPQTATIEKEIEGALTSGIETELYSEKTYREEATSKPGNEVQESAGSSWKIGVGILLILIFIGIGAYLYSNYHYETSVSSPEAVAEVSTSNTQPEATNSAEPEPQVEAATVNTVEQTSTEATNTERVLVAEPNAEMKRKDEKVSPVTETKPEKEKTHFVLNEAKAKDDLIGKSLSGCGITLNGSSEIQSITSPVLVEDATASGYIKYKLSLKVVHEGETFNVTPYLYYSPSGKFVKVDATNCE